MNDIIKVDVARYGNEQSIIKIQINRSVIDLSELIVQIHKLMPEAKLVIDETGVGIAVALHVEDLEAA